ncbi:MAG TPA: HDOD domain-containing protein [Steroidobacteraceae bacterium]|nr:HDOD domain-containing protein [Steroidobacteraceae bacterium]
MAATPEPNPVGEALLDAMRRNPQLPGLGSAFTRILAMVDSNVESIQELRDLILADVNLTQRILGIANSVVYRLNSGAGITTVTRAIVVIGFEQVKIVALGMMFVDQMPDQERAAALKAELIQALQASLLAREMTRQLAPDDKEKVAIAALLGNVSKLLLVIIDFNRFLEISRRVAHGASEASAAQDVLGMSLNSLTNEVLVSWGIPNSLAALSTGTLSPTDPKSLQKLDRIVALAKTTAKHLSHQDVAERDALLAAVRKQCIAEGGMSGELFDRWVSDADAQMAPVRNWLDSAMPAPAAPDEGFPDGSVIDDSVPLAGQLDAVGKPVNSHELVLSRLQDLTHLIAERQSLSTILLAALECLHTGFGYARSVLLLRDAGTQRMRARVWCGAITKAQASLLEFDLDAPGDLFAAAIRRGSDLQILNTSAPAFAPRLPRYFAKACPQTASFIMLPLLAESSPIACILVGRDVPEPAPISADDIRLLRTVRGQIILAMKTVR